MASIGELARNQPRKVRRERLYCGGGNPTPRRRDDPMKTCRRCNETKPPDGFSRGRNVCRKCDVARAREWVAKNRERVNEYQKEYRARRGESMRARDRAYYARVAERKLAGKRKYGAANRERIAERNRQYREGHAEAIRLQQRAFRQENAEKLRERHKRWRLSNPAAVLAGLYRRQEKMRGLKYDFTNADIKFALTWWGHACAICRTLFGDGLRGACCWDHWHAVSRADCPGTIPANMLPLCRRCNCAKKNHDPAESVRRIRRDGGGDETLAAIADYFSHVRKE